MLTLGHSDGSTRATPDASVPLAAGRTLAHLRLAQRRLVAVEEPVAVLDIASRGAHARGGRWRTR
jgi:hypothetical protein